MRFISLFNSSIKSKKIILNSQIITKIFINEPNKRYFIYDRWYKVENERQKRANRKYEEFMLSKTAFDLLKLASKETLNEATKFIEEYREEFKQDYKFGIRLVHFY